ncbi:MAG: ATP-binding protein [Janthinobacterium lividum]
MHEECDRQLALAKRQLEAVQQVSAALYSITDTNALLRQALITSMEVVDADAGSILLYNETENALVFRHAVGPVADSLVGTSLDLSLGMGIAGQVFQSGQGRVTADVEADSDHVGTVDARTGYQTRSLMTVPLHTRGGAPLGVVQLVNKHTGTFDAADMAVIEIVSSLVTMSAQNALLTREANLAAIARSVGEISHDIGNMLTHVLPYVETLEGSIADVRADKPGALDSLESFYIEVRESVAEGVGQVMARTREIASALKGEVAPLDFKPGRPFDTAQRVVSSLSGAAALAGIELRAEGDKELNAIFDGARLYNALYNLVNNALPETPPGGSILLSVAADPDPAFYTVSAADTGAGMPPEVRVKLFTDAAYSTKPGGTGLGTRIVRRIVEQHRGRPSVQSELGQGTTITLRLPKDPTAAYSST